MRMIIPLQKRNQIIKRLVTFVSIQYSLAAIRSGGNLGIVKENNDRHTRKCEALTK